MILAAQAFVAVPKSLSRIHGTINDAAAAAALLRPTHVQFFAQFLPLSPFWPAFGHFGRANGELSFKPAMPHFFLKRVFGARPSVTQPLLTIRAAPCLLPSNTLVPSMLVLTARGPMFHVLHSHDDPSYGPICDASMAEALVVPNRYFLPKPTASDVGESGEVLWGNIYVPVCTECQMFFRNFSKGLRPPPRRRPDDLPTWE